MNYVKLMRPKHYIKNLLMFIPLVFSGGGLYFNNLWITIIGFIIFSFTSSVVYIINDIYDREKDKNHPTKKYRPIASGKIKVKNAVIFLCMLLVIIGALIFFAKINIKSIVLLITYLIINLIYSFKGKHIPLLDVVLLVSGFLIRVLFGGALLNIEVSNWLYLTIISISFYLGLGKRRNEININGTKSRKVLEKYNKDFLDKNMYMFLAMTIVFYSLWSTDPSIVNNNHNLMIWTVPLVIIIAMKYSMNIEGKSDGDPVEVILHDKYLIIMGLLYAITIFTIFYLV